MHGPAVRTGSARLRPTQPKAAEGADEHYPSALPPVPASCTNRLDAERTPPLNFGHRLAQTFSLECIARRRPSNWLHEGSRRCSPLRPLDTPPRRSVMGAKVRFRRWHNRGVARRRVDALLFARVLSYFTHADTTLAYAGGADITLRYNSLRSNTSPRPPTRYNANASFRITPTNAGFLSPRRAAF